MRRSDPLGLLRRVPGLLAAGGRDDRVPPDVRRQLPPGRLLGGHEPGRHVGLAVDLLGVEVVASRVLYVDEDRVVLGRPAALGAGAVVVGPDDLVEEAVAAEDLVEQQLAVMGLAVVDVEVERALGAQQPVGLLEPGRQEREVVLEPVAVAGAVQQRRAVAPALEAGALARRVAERLQRPTLLELAGVEGRVDVDQLEGLPGEATQQLEVLAEQDLIIPSRLSRAIHRLSLRSPADGAPGL